MKTNSLFKKIGATMIMAAFTSGVMAQTSGGGSSGSGAAVSGTTTTGGRTTIRTGGHVQTTPMQAPPPGFTPASPNPPLPQNGMAPVAPSPLQNQNGVPMSQGFTNPPPVTSPMSQGFVSNTMMNQRIRRGTFAATNPPPNVSSFPFTNATGPFPQNPATGVNPP